MNFRQLIFAVIVGVTTTLTSGLWAQSITINQNMVIGRRDDRDSGLAKNAINYADCTASDYFDMTVVLSGTQDMGMQVWVGNQPACANAAGRSTLNANQCWIVHSEANAQTNIRIPVQNIIPHGRNDLEQPGTVADCEREASSQGAGDVTMYFVLTNGDDQNQVAPATWPAKYDLKGPSPPKPKGLGIGDTRLYPEWEAKTPIEDTKNLRAYCEATSAGAGVDGAECTAPTLVAGAPPPPDLASGQTNIGGTSVEVKGLTNYQRYACGVAAEDQLLNVGSVSPLMCGTPQQVVGYFKAYRDAGGQAGGGWCSYGHHTKAGALSLSAFGLVALFFAGRRRQREGRS